MRLRHSGEGIESCHFPTATNEAILSGTHQSFMFGLMETVPSPKENKREKNVVGMWIRVKSPHYHGYAYIQKRLMAFNDTFLLNKNF